MQRSGLATALTLLFVLLLLIALGEATSMAQSLEDLQRQGQDLERAVTACGTDVECLTKAAQKANEMMKGLQSHPEITDMANTPCPGFNRASFPSSEGTGEVDCLPLNVRISHRATTVTAGCTKADERFTYSYVYEGLGQLIRDTGRHAYLFNSLPPMPGGSWHLDLKNVGGDEEWLAYEIMQDHKPGSLDSYDWACPGNQWTP